MPSKLSSREKKCRLCFSKKIKQVLDLGSQPLANNLIKNKNKKEKKFPLKVFFCNSCNAAQLSETINPRILFNNYFWITSTSSTANRFSHKFYSKIINLTKIKKLFVVEIASNDVTFLLPFKNNKCRVVGVDPARNICKIANRHKIPTINSFFDKKTSNLIKKKYGKSNIIFARNVIAHVKNIHNLVEASYNLITDDGIFAVELSPLYISISSPVNITSSIILTILPLICKNGSIITLPLDKSLAISHCS